MGGIGNHGQSADSWDRILPRRGVHGFHKLLWDDLSYGDGAGIRRLSEFAALPGSLRRVPHRTGRRVVRALEAFRTAAGGRGNIPYLLAAHSLAGKVFASGSRNLRALPLAAALHRRQVPG